MPAFSKNICYQDIDTNIIPWVRGWTSVIGQKRVLKFVRLMTFILAFRLHRRPVSKYFSIVSWRTLRCGASSQVTDRDSFQKPSSIDSSWHTSVPLYHLISYFSTSILLCDANNFANNCVVEKWFPKKLARFKWGRVKLGVNFTCVFRFLSEIFIKTLILRGANVTTC